MTHAKFDPFDIPEIIICLSEYFTTSQLSHLVVVNKMWYSCFIPLLWKKIDTCVRKPQPKHLEKHRHYIERLYLAIKDAGDYQIHFPNLQCLEILERATLFPELVNRGSELLKILMLNPTIVNLKFTRIRNNIASIPWKTILEFPCLSKLELGGIFIDSDSTDLFWKVCERVSTLHLVNSKVPENSLAHNYNFPRLRELSIDRNSGITSDIIVNLIKKSPNLETLDCPSVPNLHLCLANNESLKVHDLTIQMELSDERLSLVLKEVHRLTRFSCSRFSRFGPHTFQALKPHFSTITVLELSRLHSKSETVQEILCSCPQLLEIHTCLIAAKDIADGRLWVCLLLRVFDISILFTQTEQSLQLKVFEQLSRLVQLRVLKAGLTMSGLKFSFDCGLRLLVNLKMLKEIAIRGKQIVTEEEAEWMENNLRSLETLQGFKHLGGKTFLTRQDGRTVQFSK